MNGGWRTRIALSIVLMIGLAGCDRLPWGVRSEARRSLEQCMGAPASNVEVIYAGKAVVCGVVDAGFAGRPAGPRPFVYYPMPRPRPGGTFGPDYRDHVLNRALPSAAMRDANTALLVSACAVPPDWAQRCQAGAADPPDYCRIMALEGVRTLSVFNDGCGPS